REVRASLGRQLSSYYHSFLRRAWDPCFKTWHPIGRLWQWGCVLQSSDCHEPVLGKHSAIVGELPSSGIDVIPQMHWSRATPLARDRVAPGPRLRRAPERHPVPKATRYAHGLPENACWAVMW